MIARQLPLRMIVLFAAAATSARAQTGKDLLGVCISNDPIQQTSCTHYISGFVHGLRAAEHRKGEICIPKDLTGSDARSIFVETLAYVELAAAMDRGPGRDPIFSYPQNTALATALEMKFRCPQKVQRNTGVGK
jgi:hypothetical protein